MKVCYLKIFKSIVSFNSEFKSTSLADSDLQFAQTRDWTDFIRLEYRLWTRKLSWKNCRSFLCELVALNCDWWLKGVLQDYTGVTSAALNAQIFADIGLTLQNLSTWLLCLALILLRPVEVAFVSASCFF